MKKIAFHGGTWYDDIRGEKALRRFFKARLSLKKIAIS